MHSVNQSIQARAGRCCTHLGPKTCFCYIYISELTPRTRAVYISREYAHAHNPHPYTMLTDHKFLLSGSLLLCLFLLNHILRVKRAWKAFGSLPSYTVLVSPVDVLGLILPRIPCISDGIDFGWKGVYERQPLPSLRFSSSPHASCLGVFATSEPDIVQLRSLLPDATPRLLLADAAAIKVESVARRCVLCSICHFRQYFRAKRHFPSIIET